MKEYDWTRYLGLCMGYRIVTVILSTAAYLFLMVSGRMVGIRVWVVALGMTAACFLGNRLYREMEYLEEKKWMKATIAVEMFANGMFLYMSGGISSPYLWYCLGCLLIMITSEKRKKYLAIGVGWYIVCAAAGSRGIPADYERLNLVLGLFGVVGGFLIIGSYIQKLQEQKEMQQQLNLQLEQEKQRSELALSQVTNLYESIQLLAMTDRGMILEELSSLLNRTIAENGCMLLLLDREGQARYRGISGMPKEQAGELTDRVLKRIKDDGLENMEVTYDNRNYVISMAGGGIWNRVVFIREEADRKDAGEENYYQRLVEIILQNLELQEQAEKLIALEEQNRIANEIHDTVIQKLFGMDCSLKLLEVTAEQFPQEGREPIGEKLHMLRATTEATMKELRQTIYGKRFEHAEDSFVKRLEAYMKEMEQLCGTEIATDLDPTMDEMDAAQKTAVYRVVCEAVNNAIRHGKAEQVNIHLCMKTREVEAEILDNGTGFVKSAERSAGNGLQNMNRMAAVLRGKLTLETSPGNGTRILLCFPRQGEP